MIPKRLSLVLVLALACMDRPTPVPAVQRTSAAESLTSPIRIEHSATRDLTGDGVPERLALHAAGSQYDSLDVGLEIRDGRTRAPLYAAAWRSTDYFRYDPSITSPNGVATREQITRRQLARVLNDSAFVPPHATLPDGRTQAVDPDAVTYHLRELAWRRAHGIADTASTPREADEQLGHAGVPTDSLHAEAAAVVAELRGRPTFTYHAGGELTYTIAWSDRQHAFVRVFSCC